MPITFRHDAAAVALPSTSANRKYGQQLVLQQQQQKYAAQQAGYDRLLTLGRDAQQSAFQLGRDNLLNQFQVDRDNRINAFQSQRDKTQFEQQQQMQEAERQRKFMDDARQQSGRFIMDSIANGEYDDVTARELRQNLIDEAEALGNPRLDATQRAEALEKIRARRAVLSANRQPKAPPPTPQQQFEQGVVTDPATGMRYRQNAKGDYEELPQQEQRPSSASEAFAADPKLRDKYMEEAIAIETKGGELPLDRDSRKKAAELSQKLWEDDNLPNAAPELPGQAAPAAKPPMQSILEQPGAALPDEGVPPSPVRPGMAQRPDEGMPPAPVRPVGGQQPPQMSAEEAEYDAEMTAKGYKLVTPEDGSRPYYYYEHKPANQTSQPTPAPQQQVKVGGKPLAVSPGTLTPQETAARQQIMELPREQRIAALMPYDPELKGKTLDQLLEDPATKAGYEELTKQGLTTGNYREDMLSQLDEMLQHNVMNAAGQSPQDAYVGMRADDITDPKLKAEVSKMPRPKSAEELKTIRGRYFIDPDGVIRSTQKV